MALYDPIPEPDEQLTKLMSQQIETIEAEIKAGDEVTIRAVAALTGIRGRKDSLNCDEDEAEALVRAAVIYRTGLVGQRIYTVVKLAVDDLALERAQKQLAQQDRNRRETADEARIERAIDARGAA